MNPESVVEEEKNPIWGMACIIMAAEDTAFFVS